ncbi:MAG: hypothetical protein KTR25_12385 [Myxococcales bacterium]|nr:hypothetical protein [Myxococcales bacterium]
MNAHVVLRGRDLRTLDTTYAAHPGAEGRLYIELTDEGVRTMATDSRRLASAFVSREVSTPVRGRILAVPGFQSALRTLGAVSELHMVICKGGAVIFEADNRLIVEPTQELGGRPRFLQRTRPHTQVTVNKKALLDQIKFQDSSDEISIELESSGMYVGEDGFIEAADFDGDERTIVLPRIQLEEALGKIPGRKIVLDAPKGQEPVTVTDARNIDTYAILRQTRPRTRRR